MLGKVVGGVTAFLFFLLLFFLRNKTTTRNKETGSAQVPNGAVVFFYFLHFLSFFIFLLAVVFVSPVSTICSAQPRLKSNEKQKEEEIKPVVRVAPVKLGN